VHRARAAEHPPASGAHLPLRRTLIGGSLLAIATLGLTTFGPLAAPAGAVSSTPAAGLVSGTAPSSAIELEPNSDIQSAVNAYPVATAFLLTKGLYAGFTVMPKADDRFFAQPGVILDGGHVLASAFRGPVGGSVNGVQIIGSSNKAPLVIQDYGLKSHSQIAAVQTSSQTSAGPVYSSGWRMQWVNVTNNLARGVSLSNQMLVMQCQVSSNGRLGIGGGGTGITIADSVVNDNGIGVSQKGWEAGGIKTVAQNVLIEHNTISGNGAPGIWTDGGAARVAVSGNHLSSNFFGMQIEISRNITITANDVSTSEQQAILVVASQGVRITGNTLTNNHQGIIVGGSTRTGPQGIHLDNVRVSHNSLEDTGGNGLHQPLLPGDTVNFDWDHYVGSHVQWNGEPLTFARLQAIGQELHGSFAP
jgi:parallel beta-helix repeat protein